MQKHYALPALLIPIFLFLLFFQNNLTGKDSGSSQGRSVNSWDYSQIDVNNISAWITNYGSLFRHPLTGNSGLEWPKGGGVFAVYASGLWIGAKVNNDVRVAVAEYSYEFGPGSIDPITHQPNDPNDPRYVVYKFNQGDVIPQQAIEDGCPSQVWGDQMLWSVYNDADPAYHTNMVTAPLGLEIQQTAFAWNIGNNPVINNLVFIRWLIINKSSQSLDSAYIAVWSDPDLGDSGDDYVGCDTTLSLGYCYNSQNIDSEYGTAPPAVGYDYLQGPIVPSPGDSARFLGKWIYGYKNLPMTSFVYYNNNNSINGNPQTGPEVYNYMQSLWRDGSHMTYGGDGTNPNNPLTNFMFTGDPEAGTGWFETSPSDKRFLMSTGPFTMAPGDSQEIYVGVYMARGSSNLNSATLLKQYAPQVKSFFLDPGPYSNVAYKINHPTTSTTELQVQADLEDYNDATSCELDFNPQMGFETGFNLILYDDGMHNDSLAGDRIWGNSITINNKKYPFKGDLTIYRTGGPDDYPDILNNLTLRPTPEFINWQVTWENGQQDSSLNYNEKVHLSFDLFNSDNLQSIDTIVIINSDPRTNNQMIELNQIISPGSIVSSEILYLELFGPSQGDSLNFSYRIEFDGHSLNLSSAYPVIPWNPHPLWQDTLDVTSVSGNPDNLLPIVADPNLLTGHQYQVTFIEDTPQDSLWWRLKDITIAQILIDSAHIGESPDLDYPVIDGVEWKVFSPIPGFTDFQVVANASGPLDPPEGAAADWFDFPGIGAPTDNQQVGAGKWLIHCGGGIDYFSFLNRVLRNDNADRAIPYDFEIRFTAGPNYGNWWYEDQITRLIPFELWNIGINTPDDPSDDYRMLPKIAMFEIPDPLAFQLNPIDHVVSSQSDDPYTNWVYWFDPSDKSPGTAGYDAAVAEGIGIPVPFDPNSEEVMARTVLVNWNGGDVNDPNFPANVNQLMPEQGTVFRIITAKISTATDTLLVTTPVVGINNPSVINTFYLSQNYPNPFNPTTNIRFSIAQSEKVKLEVFNVLGQKVKTLVNKKMKIGQYEIKWDGRNESGNLLGSGIYFYRLIAGDYIKTRKMIFLK